MYSWLLSHWHLVSIHRDLQPPPDHGVYSCSPQATKACSVANPEACVPRIDDMHALTLNAREAEANHHAGAILIIRCLVNGKSQHML